MGTKIKLNNIISDCSNIIKFVKLTKQASKPTKATPFAAGFDLYSAENSYIPKMGKKLIKTDISIAIPNGFYGRIAPRSGLALKHFIDIGGGVIDSDYRGNIFILLYNFGSSDFKIKIGDRIAQIIITKILLPELIECKNLEITERNNQAFGSTGI